MAILGINGVSQKTVDEIQTITGKQATQLNHILEFADNANVALGDKEPSEAKLKTEMFKDEVMNKLDTSKSKRTPKTIKYYLSKLIEVAQELNGVRKNNLKPNGTKKQNEVYEGRIKERLCQMKDYAEFVGSGLSVVQDSKTGLYKICIDNKLYDIPERKVEIVTVKVDAIYPEDLTEELMPEIVD